MEPAIIKETAIFQDTLKSIYERRAVRKYKDVPVDRELIEKIIDAGKMAPSALNKQPWNFHVVRKKETIRSFSKAILKIMPGELMKAEPKVILKQILHFLHFPHGLSFLKTTDPVFHSAPVVIFITADRENEWAPLDIGMCAQNIMLAANYFGLDTCPIGFGKYIEHTDLYPQLKIPAKEQVHLAIIVGYGDEKPEMHERVQKSIYYVD
jgi:nitroreductase